MKSKEREWGKMMTACESDDKAIHFVLPINIYC